MVDHLLHFGRRTIATKPQESFQYLFVFNKRYEKVSNDICNVSFLSREKYYAPSIEGKTW
jgi:hypothetical protein